MAGIKGCDVSRWQGQVDWQQVKASGQADFVILRAGLGQRQVDPLFESHYTGCRAAGLPMGVYWYSQAADTAAAQKEAKACLGAIQGKQLEYPVWFDQEYQPGLAALTNRQRTDIVQTFCAAVQGAGYYTGLYCSLDWLKESLDSSRLKAYDLWVADYGKTLGPVPLPYGMWQYTGTGRLPGISTSVDLDLAYKNYPAIIRKAGLNHLA